MYGTGRCIFNRGVYSSAAKVSTPWKRILRTDFRLRTTQRKGIETIKGKKLTCARVAGYENPLVGFFRFGGAPFQGRSSILEASPLTEHPFGCFRRSIREIRTDDYETGSFLP